MAQYLCLDSWLFGTLVHCRGKEDEESLDGEEDSLTSEKKERQRQRERYITSQNYKTDPWTDRRTDIYDPFKDVRSHLNRRTPPSRYPQKKIKRTILKTQNLPSRRYRNSKTRSGEILPKQIF